MHTSNLKRLYGPPVLAGLMLAASTSMVTGHDGDTEGHVAANVNYGFSVVGRDTLAGIADGLYTDVWSHKGYAYVGTFQDPSCTDAGVFIVDIEAAIANYDGGNGSIEGATVAEIKSAPNTRINDVKVHTVGDRDILITTQEPCGQQIPGWALSDGNSNPNGQGAAFQVGQGGISLYDVTDPLKPRSVKRNFMEYEGVHNTFPFDVDGRSYLIGTADTFDFFDTFTVDITNPQSPRLLALTGALDWIPQGVNLDQLETGSSGGIFNHDVWVNEIDGVPTAVVSYWDLGFVTLDVSDPANPLFIADSTYPLIEPIVGRPYEGNAHAAVFGANGDYIFGGDEDFSDSSFGVNYGGVDYPAAQANFGPPSIELVGEVIWTDSEGCSPADVPDATDEGQVALIQRGSCFFQDKADSAEAKGYAGYIVANDQARGNALINMAPRDDAPVGIPGVFVGYDTGEIMKVTPSQMVAAGSVFDGWGYLHVINNTGVPIEVPTGGMASGNTKMVSNMHHTGYYAPAEAVEAPVPGADPVGDLTMHNIEADPLTQDITPTFNGGPRMFVSWYSLGMRALEYRPGHFHENQNDEGSYSENVHEVGRYIAEDGSNYWGIHIDERPNGDQIILASDRNTGLWIFNFSCETRSETGESQFYCDPETDGSGG